MAPAEQRASLIRVNGLPTEFGQVVATCGGSASSDKSQSCTGVRGAVVKAESPRSGGGAATRLDDRSTREAARYRCPGQPQHLGGRHEFRIGSASRSANRYGPGKATTLESNSYQRTAPAGAATPAATRSRRTTRAKRSSGAGACGHTDNADAKRPGTSGTEASRTSGRGWTCPGKIDPIFLKEPMHGGRLEGRSNLAFTRRRPRPKGRPPKARSRFHNAHKKTEVTGILAARRNTGILA